MRVFRGFHHPGLSGPQAVTIGSFDGVHRGHQAMFALLANEARHRGLASCALTFEPHPRDWFAAQAGRPEAAPARISSLRDKLAEIERCGIDRAVVLRFDARLAALSAQAFIDEVLVAGLATRWLLVGDDFRFGARRAGDYALLDADRRFDTARMQSYEVHGLRVSSSAVRAALAEGHMADACTLLGRPYSVAGHVQHGAKLGRTLGFRTLNLRFEHPRPAAGGIFVVRTHGLAEAPLDGVASFGPRPTVDDGRRVLLEVHCLDWPAALGGDAAYGRLVRVELLHRLREVRRYDGLDALRAAIAADVQAARDWLAAARG